MGIRETLNKHPAVSVGSVMAILAIALIASIVHMRSSRPRIYVGNQFFFTDNDGETWFAADRSNIPPFIDKNGLTAVRCYVFKCGKTQFVGYLEKYTDEARQALIDIRNKATATPAAGEIAQAALRGQGRLLKKRKDSEWVPFDPTNSTASEKIATILNVQCPDGGSNATVVNPGD